MKLKNNEVEDGGFEETTLPSKLQTHRAIFRPINPSRKHPVASEQTQLMARPGIQRKWSASLMAYFCSTYEMKIEIEEGCSVEVHLESFPSFSEAEDGSFIFSEGNPALEHPFS
ncbi:hypothetical protein TNIN_353301 [Trichonephila inaurata madagascariensis]|uniref:Uncharacterized protein n=1 Tax=Trichonephila inaurata madagascariensis TaxID=2747483 RepID=A0A8X6X4V6_9ARAC|nr:hypothetical protein TNIN_353301 [Trichonephila inaurata madagascariensis]